MQHIPYTIENENMKCVKETTTRQKRRKQPVNCCFIGNHTVSPHSEIAEQWSNVLTTNATWGAGSAYPSGAPDTTFIFGGVRVAQSLVFYVVFCVLLFVYNWSFSCFSHGVVCLFSTHEHDCPLEIFRTSCFFNLEFASLLRLEGLLNAFILFN